MSSTLPLALRFLAGIALVTGVFAADDAAPRRKTVRIAGAWNLTAVLHDKTEMDGERTKVLTCTGKPTLKHGRNMINGPWDVDAKADTIKCDFDGKKFILSGSPQVQRKDPKGKVLSIVAGEKETVIELAFADAKMTVTGPSKTAVADPDSQPGTPGSTAPR